MAALAYAAVFIAWTWPLARDPLTTVSIPASYLAPDAPGIMVDSQNDQLLTIWGVTANARSILHLDVRKLIDHGLCYPTKDASFLGEHMIEAGLLGVPAYALTGNPLASYDFACLASVVIAGTAMFALLLYWTGSASAALMAGLLFAFHPSRIDNLIHLAVVGNHWTPLILLSFERLLDRGRARDAALLATFATFQSLTGAYPLLALAVFACPFGVIRLYQKRRRLDARRLALLVAAVLVTCCAVGMLLFPYIRGQQTWKVMTSRWTVFATIDQIVLPGTVNSVGAIIVALALMALLAFLRPTGGPGAALAAASIVSLLFATDGQLWAGGPHVAPLYSWLRMPRPSRDSSACRLPCAVPSIWERSRSEHSAWRVS